eukprot:scaffold60217_cov73-Cyclotella_meneghiniana.AAC.3
MSPHTAVAPQTLLPLLQQHHISTLQGGVVNRPPPTHRGKFIPFYSLASLPLLEPAPSHRRICNKLASVGGGGCGGDRVDEAAAATHNLRHCNGNSDVSGKFGRRLSFITNATSKCNFRGVGWGSGAEQYNN